MGKVNIREKDPLKYAAVKAAQEELSKKCAALLKVARICPYCGHSIEFLCKGNHSFSQVKCPVCGEPVTFPPISFRLSR